MKILTEMRKAKNGRDRRTNVKEVLARWADERKEARRFEKRRWPFGTPEPLKEKVFELHLDNPRWTIRRIAEKVGLNGTTVSKILKERGVTFSRGRRGPEVEVPDTVQERIIRLYDDKGYSINDVAKALAETAHSLSYAQVRRILMYNDIEIRGTTVVTEEMLERAALILEWREQGYSLKECGEDLQMTRQGAHRVERKALELKERGLI